MKKNPIPLYDRNGDKLIVLWPPPDLALNETIPGYLHRTALSDLPPQSGGGGDDENGGSGIWLWGCVLILMLVCAGAFAWIIWQWACCGLTL